MGIGIGLIIFSLIFLYIQTKDRWKWKKIFKICSISLITGYLCVVLILIYSDHMKNKKYEKQRILDDIQSKMDAMPKVLIGFCGIQLGNSKDDVLFKLGNPSKMEKDFYYYESMGISFEENKVDKIIYLCNSKDKYKSFFTSLNGIKCGDNTNNIVNRFGKELNIQMNEKNKTVRFYNVPKYNCRYILSKDSVNSLVVMSFSKKNQLSD